jgi:GNAT superfamily N-acetyltransferase
MAVALGGLRRRRGIMTVVTVATTAGIHPRTQPSLGGQYSGVGDSNVFVVAAYRNRGIGSQLVSAALNYADENGFARVVLSPTEKSIPLYERAGFGPARALMLRTPPQAPTGSASRST